jgi:hypothetical protein
MPDYSSVPRLVVYPFLWDQSRQRFPFDYQWPDQLRLLCRLAREYRRAHGREVNALPQGERMFLQCLDEVDVEDLITTLRNDYPGEANPMVRIDPADPGVDRSQYPGLYPEMNGRKYPHG